MKSYFALLAITVASLPLAAESAHIVNVNALCPTGTSITLSAGTYEVNVIGTKQGGQYNGWAYSTQNFGTPTASPAPNTWVDSFSMTAGGVSNTFVAAGNPRSDNAIDALGVYQSSILEKSAGLTPVTTVGTPASSSLNSAFFTLSSAQSVDFTVADYLFADNWGGVSLEVTPQCASSATPEPSTFGLMGLAFAGTLAAFRRKVARS